MGSEARAPSPPITQPLRLSAPAADEVRNRSSRMLWRGGKRPPWTFESIRRQFAHVTVRSTLGLTTVGGFRIASTRPTATVSPTRWGRSCVAGRLLPAPLSSTRLVRAPAVLAGLGARSGATVHRDCGDAFLGQLIGRKRFELYSPTAGNVPMDAGQVGPSHGRRFCGGWLLPGSGVASWCHGPDLATLAGLRFTVRG